MSRTLFSALGLTAGLALVAAPAQAQYAPSTILVNRGQMEVSGYAGYMFTSHFAGGSSVNLGSGNGAVYGAQLALPLSPNASLVGGLGYSSADLKATAFGFGTTVGTSTAWIYEGDLQLNANKQKTGTLQGFSPFMQVGLGAIHRSLTSFGLGASSTDFAINGGVGVDFEVSQGIGLRLMAKDYIGKASFDSGLATTNTLNNIALDAGVKLSF